MMKYANNQLADLNETLSHIALTAANELQKAERSAQAAQHHIRNLKEFILQYEFKDEQEEIRFFKEVKPAFCQEKLYHNEVYFIEAKKPVANNETLIAYYRQVMERVTLYFARNKEFYNYYLAEKTSLDHLYFLRNVHDLSDHDIEMDMRFCTVHGQKLSKLLAFERISKYIQRKIYQMQNPEMVMADGKEHKFNNHWTDSKAALIELAYALQARGSINGGRTDIRQIITDFEVMFNVELGNFYRTFQNLRIRKKNPTPFLDGLKDSLEKKMEDGL